MSSFDPSACFESALRRLARWSHRHPRRLAFGVVTVLGGFAATAFGVVPLAPDAAELPRHLVTEAYAPTALDAQLDALVAQRVALNRHEVTRASDSVDSLLARLGVADADLAGFLRHDTLAHLVWQGRPGKMVSAVTERDGRLDRLVVRFPAAQPEQYATHFSRLTIERVTQAAGAARFESRLETVPMESSPRLASGSIRSSLFAATDAADIPDPVAMQLAEIFSTDVDFHRELRKGDTFSVVYEALTADGEPITWNQGGGRVLAAEFVNAGRPYQAVWFGEAGRQGGYFDLEGRSKRHAFLASPLAFSRVTSGFSMRMHPILKTWKAHLGVDYGAPTGTPVRVVGDGTVEFAGRQNGYGNVIQVRHSNNRLTVYAHLSRIDVRRGERVEQGERIGAVGATGWATGPHLHFEFRVDGVHHDPLTIAKDAETLALDAAERPRFAVLAQTVKAQLAVAETLVSRSTQAD